MANVSSSNGLEKRPKLRFPGFDEPWSVYKAEDLFKNIVDKNHPTETVLTIIQGKGTLPREQAGRNIHYDDASLSNYKKVEKGDFIIHLRSFEGGLEMANEDGIVSPAYTILRCKKPHSSLFYEAYFHTDEFINHILSKSVEGIRDGRQISYEAFKWLGLPYCDVAEQEKIAQLFSTINHRIEKQQQMVDALKKYKRGLLSREFAPVTHNSRSIEYEGKILDFFSLSSGSTPSSTNKSFYSGNIRWVSSGELKPKYLCETNQHISAEAVSNCNLREYPANTLLIAMYGLEAAGVRGTASILAVPATISQACMAIQQIGEIDIEYLYYWYIYNGQWIGIRIAQGTKQQNLSTETLGNLKIYAPSSSKQKEVCKLLSQIDNLIEKESQKTDLLCAVKKGLLQQLFI